MVLELCPKFKHPDDTLGNSIVSCAWLGGQGSVRSYRASTMDVVEAKEEKELQHKNKNGLSWNAMSMLIQFKKYFPDPSL